MTYEEYKKAVYEACKKDGVTKAYPQEFEQTFLEEEDMIREDYKKGNSPESTAWYICLMV